MHRKLRCGGDLYYRTVRLLFEKTRTKSEHMFKYAKLFYLPPAIGNNFFPRVLQNMINCIIIDTNVGESVYLWTKMGNFLQKCCF